MKNKETILKFVLMSGSMAFCLLIAEVVLSAFFPQISHHDAMFQDDDLLGWTFKPAKRGAIVYPGESSHFIQTNTWGFRDNEFDKDQKEKRVMFIGDSFVSNISVEDEEVFTEVLEKNIPGLDAMNFGVNGYGQVQEMLLLDRWVDKVEPDLVVLTVYVRNDFADNVRSGQWNRAKPVAKWNQERGDITLHSLAATGKQKAVAERFYHKMHLYHFVSRRLANIKRRNINPGDKEYLSQTPPELYLCKKEPDASMQEMQIVMNALIQRMHTYLTRKNIPFALVIAPSIFQIEDELWERLIKVSKEGPEQFDRERPNSWFKQLGEDQQIPVFDLFPVLYRETQVGQTMYNREEQHWNKEGNEIVAEELEKFLRVNFSTLF